MRIREMRELAADELKGRIDDARKEIVDLRFQHACRKLDSPSKLRLARKRLARLLTVQSQKETK